MGGGTDSIWTDPGGPGELAIELLGRGSVTIAQQPVRFATRHAELFVYLLALAGADGLARDDVISALWPEVELHDARPRLRTALWQVRRALGEHAWRIARERGVVLFDLDGVRLDVAPDRPIRRAELLIGWNVSLPQVLLDRVS